MPIFQTGSTSASSMYTTSGGPVPGGRGVGPVDVDAEEQRDAEYRWEMVDEVEITSFTMTPKTNSKAKTASAKAKPNVIVEITDSGRSKSPPPVASRSKRNASATDTARGDTMEVEDIINFGDDEGVGFDDADIAADAAMDIDEEHASPAKSLKHQKPKLSEKSKKPIPRQARGGTTIVDDSGSRSRNPQPRPCSRLVRKIPASDAENIVTDQGQATDGVYRYRETDEGGSAEDEHLLKANAKANGTSVAPRKPRLPATSHESSDSEPSPSRSKPIPGTSTPVKTGMKPKFKPKETPQRAMSLSDDDEIFARPVKSQSSPSKAKVNDPAKEPLATSSIVKEKRNLRARSSTRSPSPPIKTIKTPKRTVSVLVPSLSKEYLSPSSGKDAPTNGKGKPELARTTSIRVSAAEASTSGSKRGRPSLSKSCTSTPPVKNKSKSKVQTESEPEHADEGSAGMDSSSTSRGLSKRSAANKATSKLRDEIMPDVINFEKERKNAKRRRSSGLNAIFMPVSDEEQVEQKRDGKRRRVVNSREEDEEEEAEVEDVISSSKSQTKFKTGTTRGNRPKKRAEYEMSVDEDELSKGKSAKATQNKKESHAHNVETNQPYVICSPLPSS